MATKKATDPKPKTIEEMIAEATPEAFEKWKEGRERGGARAILFARDLAGVEKPTDVPEELARHVTEKLAKKAPSPTPPRKKGSKKAAPRAAGNPFAGLSDEDRAEVEALISAKRAAHEAAQKVEGAWGVIGEHYGLAPEAIAKLRGAAEKAKANKG